MTLLNTWIPIRLLTEKIQIEYKSIKVCDIPKQCFKTLRIYIYFLVSRYELENKNFAFWVTAS